MRLLTRDEFREGVFDAKSIQKLENSLDHHEGYCVRIRGSFYLQDWRHGPYGVNQLRR